MTKALVVALAALGTFACSAAVEEGGAESGDTSEEALGQPALSCPTSLTMNTSLGAFAVGAIGRVRTIRSRIVNNALVCEATGDPVPAFSKNFSTAAVKSALADLVGSLSHLDVGRGRLQYEQRHVDRDCFDHQRFTHELRGAVHVHGARDIRAGDAHEAVQRLRRNWQLLLREERFE